MEVIWKEDVPKLGSRGDVVRVPRANGRNFLLPRKLAIEANSANKAVIEQMKSASVAGSAKEKHEARRLQQFEGCRCPSSDVSGRTNSCSGRLPPVTSRTRLRKEELPHRFVGRSRLHEPLKSWANSTCRQALQGRDGSRQGVIEKEAVRLIRPCIPPRPGSKLPGSEAMCLPTRVATQLFTFWVAPPTEPGLLRCVTSRIKTAIQSLMGSSRSCKR